MNVARFNFSHGSYEEHGGRLAKLKALREELGKPVAALLDTKGPEIRLKEFKNGVEMLEAGQTFTLTTREVEGTNEICSVTYKDLPQDVQPGGTIMLDDGLIMLHIEQVTDTDIICTVLNSGKIKTKKGVNVPGVHLLHAVPEPEATARTSSLACRTALTSSLLPLCAPHRMCRHPQPAERVRLQHPYHCQNREPRGREQHRQHPLRSRCRHGRPW